MEKRVKELRDAANILRRDVLRMTSIAGSGHPTSCLSCAEIISVLFFNEMKFDVSNSENPDNDEFILSKGHAAPILYSALKHAGCIKDKLDSLRKLNSNLEGHPIPKSLKWVKVATGSLGQGLSIGCGFALAAKKQGRKFRTYVLLGDSECAEGQVYETLQFTSFYNLNNLCAIVDVNRLGQSGETMLGWKVEKYSERFKSFGWNCEIIDGHNTKGILEVFEKAKKSKKPFAIIAKTTKGNGVSFLENKNGWHGKVLNKTDLEKALQEIPDEKFPKFKILKPERILIKENKNYSNNLTDWKRNVEVSTRDAYGKTLAEISLGKNNLIVVDAEVSNSTETHEVKKVSPEKFVEAFIAEQNLVGVCLGLSKKGFNVFGSTFSAFLTRAHDQIRMASLSSANLTLCGSHSGISIGEDGASQMGLDDIAMFRTFPNSIIFYPCDAVSTQKIVEECLKIKGIKYIRTTRGRTPVIYNLNEKFKVGDFKILKESARDKVVLVGAGITLHECLKAYEELKKKRINCSVVDLYCLKPFNFKKFESFVNEHGRKLVVSEDHYSEGGIGEMLSSNLNGIKVTKLSVKEIPHSGKSEELLEKYGIDWKAIVKSVEKIC